MNRRRFLAKAVAMTGAASLISAGTSAIADRVKRGHEALICEGCAFHKEHYKCAVCGKKECGDLDYFEVALICNSCCRNEKICFNCGRIIKTPTKARVCRKCCDKARLTCARCGGDMS